MKTITRALGLLISVFLVGLTTFVNVNSASAQIDVSYLQTCLKEEGSSLDVLVLMDSSKSLRDARPDERAARKIDGGSDPTRQRGPILKSSLKLLRTLAEESEKSFNISLRNFGKNSDPTEQKKLSERWVNWTDEASDENLDDFIEKALFDDSPGTEWTNGIKSAKDQFKERIGEAKLAGAKSCGIMFWITDGAPTDSTDPICASSGDASIDWFRENNILVLGGLLQPRDGGERDDASKFKPIVEGNDCGRNESTWTQGEVIEADDITALAWGFISLIANIKNLVNLDASNSSFIVDPSTSQIDIYLRRSGAESDWQIKKPDRSIFCSASNLGSRCQVSRDADVGITTISIFPEQPVGAAGTWSVSPTITEQDLLAYGGLNTSSPDSAKTQPKLVIAPAMNLSAEEGKSLTFQAKLVNADGSIFNTNGFNSVTICAKITSNKANACKSEGASASLSVVPNSADRSVAFEAILISAKYPSREYRITTSARINVIPSGVFPTLVCSSSPCKFTDLANKNDKAVSTLQVKAPESGDSTARVYLIGFSILADSVKDRGDGHFFYEVKRANGDVINLGDESALLSPEEKLELTVTTDEGGSGEVQGVLKYKVLANGQELERELSFSFDVSSKKNWVALIALMLLAYILTVGIPYLFLLWSARRAAVLTVPGSEYSVVTLPIIVSPDGKFLNVGPEASTTTLEAPHTQLVKSEISPGSRSVNIDQATIEITPPKWNPFAASITHVSIPGHHLLTTFSDGSVVAETTDFSPSLVNEAIAYFPTEQNFAPIMQAAKSESKESDYFGSNESQWETAISQELAVATHPVTGTVILIVIPYENKKKSIAEVINKLNSTIGGKELTAKIKELRESALSSAKQKAELDAASSQDFSKKPPKDSKKGTQEQKIKDESKKEGSSSFFDDKESDTGSWAKDDSSSNDFWGDDKGDFPDSGKDSKSW